LPSFSVTYYLCFSRFSLHGEENKMKKSMFWTGLSMFSIQVLGILVYLFSTLDYSWITSKLVISVIILTCFALFNIISIILIFVGIFKKDEEE
jgi:hypothetical protein